MASEAVRPTAPPSFGVLVRRVLSDPQDALSSALAIARARLALRQCAEAGFGPRLYGRCRVLGGGGIRIGQRLLVAAETVPCELATHEGGQLEIGDRVFINYGASISAHQLVWIGDDCKIGQYAIILDCDFHELDTPTHDGGHGRPAPVVLEHGVWLSARVTVLKGVTIGRGSVIAAGSVVSKDVPPGVLAGGVPARVLRRLSFAETD